MRKTEISFLSRACNAEIFGNQDKFVYDVKIDSREAGDGDLFVCVIGENNDGHKYAEGAYENGCRCFLMSDKRAAESMVSKYADVSVIFTTDTIKAFEKMAAWYISQFNIKKIAITGSVGKTTTKTLTAAVCSGKYNTICTQKNLNTNLGLCLTSFLADEDTEAIVFEMGMDASGQISEYVDFIAPEIAIITNIGVSHMERLGSRDAIADAKLEIVKNFNENNTLIVNAQSDYLSDEKEIRERAKNKTNFKISLVEAPAAIKNNAKDGIEFCIDQKKYTLPLLGEHNAIDAALAVEAGKILGIEYESMSAALAKVESNSRRLKAEEINGIMLLDDSYNASPDSMFAGLSALASIDGKRHIAILADMYELGEAEEDGHFAVGRSAAENGIDILLAVGMNRRLYAAGVSSYKNSHCNVIALESKESAMDIVDNLLKPGDVVLVKGSNGTKISEVAEHIRKAGK